MKRMGFLVFALSLSFSTHVLRADCSYICQNPGSDLASCAQRFDNGRGDMADCEVVGYCEFDECYYDCKGSTCYYV